MDTLLKTTSCIEGPEWAFGSGPLNKGALSDRPRFSLSLCVVEWMLRKGGGGMKLENIARDFASNLSDEEKSIDFGAAGLYLPAAQTIFATTLSSCVSVLACWLIPVGAISAVRTLALTASAGLIVIRRPVKVGQTRGVNTIFAALRPCCLIYVGCLVLEQLIHTCISDESTYEHGFWRRIIYHANMTVMTLAAFMRSKSPRAESDLPFLFSSGALLCIAILPPPALALSGPLCSPPTLSNAGERILRAFLFSCVYVVLVYSAAPISNNLPDTLVCIARSATASAWILGAVSYSLPLALAQIFVVIYCSFSPTNIQYESVLPKHDDVESHNDKGNGVAYAGAVNGMSSHSDVGRSVTPVEEDPEVANAVAILKSTRMASVQPVLGAGLSFNLSGVGHVSSDFREQ